MYLRRHKKLSIKIKKVFHCSSCTCMYIYTQTPYISYNNCFAVIYPHRQQGQLKTARTQLDCSAVSLPAGLYWIFRWDAVHDQSRWVLLHANDIVHHSYTVLREEKLATKNNICILHLKQVRTHMSLQHKRAYSTWAVQIGL